MKKILSFILLAALLVLPTTILVGCSKKSDDARNVVNNVYYLSSVYEDRVNITNTNYNERPLKIIFGDTSVKVEIGNLNEENHGIYLGSFTTEGSSIKITITGSSRTGVFEDENTFNLHKFEDLTFKNGKISVSFFHNSKIYQYTFTKAN